MKRRAGFGLPEKRDSVAPPLFSEKKMGSFEDFQLPRSLFQPSLRR